MSGFAPAPEVELEVEDLGDPHPTPFAEQIEKAEELERQSAEGSPPLSSDQIANRLVPLLRVPFAVAGVAFSRQFARGSPAREECVELWQVSDAEVRPIADVLAPVIPAHWLVERALAYSPWGAAGWQLYNLVSLRLDATEQLVQEDRIGRPTDRPRPTGVPRPEPPRPDGSADRAGDDGFEGAGLGF